MITEKKMDWHLFWTAAGVVVPLVCVMVGGFWHISNKFWQLNRNIAQCKTELSKEISELRNEVSKIETVLIIKGIVPTELFASENKEVKKCT